MRKIIHYKVGTYLEITETWIYEQIRSLRRYSPIVYTHMIENSDIYPTAVVRSLGLGRVLNSFTVIFNKICNKLFNFYPSFILSLLNDKPNLIHAHYGPSGYDFIFYKRLFKLPMITTFYGYDISQLPNLNSKWLKRYKRLFNNGDYFLIEGSNMRRSLIKLGCPEEKIIVHHIGVDLDKIEFTPRNINDGDLIKVLLASNFREKKGIPYAIEAFNRVRKSHPELDLELTIIGDSDGRSEGEEEKKKVLNLINKYNLKKYIRLLGYMPHKMLLKEAKNHHIFISPSINASNGDNEGGAPVAIIEMAASGMPILSTRHCDIPEVVIDGKSGLLANERDIDDLARKLELLVLNPKKWKKMGEYSRKHIELEYNVKKQILKLEEIYDIFA